MSILDRLQRLARSEWSALRGEGAQRELDAAIREAESAIVDLRSSERTFNADYQDQLDRVQRHEDAAAEAVRAGDDATARRELWARQEALERADSARSRLERVRRQIDEAVGMLRGARAQVELDAPGTWGSPATAQANGPIGTTAAAVQHALPASTAPHAPPVVPPPAYRSSTSSPAVAAAGGLPAAYGGTGKSSGEGGGPAPTSPSGALPDPYGARAAAAPPVTAPPGPTRSIGHHRFDPIGLDAGPAPSAASIRIDAKLDHFEAIAARVDANEADALLDPAAEDRRTEAAIGDAFRRLEVERLRSSANPDEDGALDRLRQRMGDGPPRD